MIIFDFDFDLTLVDTSPIAHLREKRQWNAVNAKLSELKVYDGINEMLNELNERSQKLAIVTKSPDMAPRYFILASWGQPQVSAPVCKPPGMAGR